MADLMKKLLDDACKEMESLRFKNLQLTMANEKLTTKLGELNGFLDEVPIAYVELAYGGVFTRVNIEFCRLFEYDKSEIIGKNFITMLTIPEEIEYHKKSFEVFKDIGVNKYVNWHMRAKRGRIIPVIMHARAVYDEHNNYTYCRAFIIDKKLLSN